MSKRIQSRRGNGQYQRSTLANTFGLGNEICDECGQCHPYEIGVDAVPETCSSCRACLPTYSAKLEREEEEFERIQAYREFRDMWRNG